MYILKKKKCLWNWTNILFPSSKSQSLMVPLAAPAATKTSEESKLTESIPLVWPDKLWYDDSNTTSWNKNSLISKMKFYQR